MGFFLYHTAIAPQVLYFGKKTMSCIMFGNFSNIFVSQWQNIFLSKGCTILLSIFKTKCVIKISENLRKSSQYTNIIIGIKHFDVGVPALGLHRILITPNIGQIFCWISGKSNIEFSSEKMYLYLVFYKSAYKVIYVYNPSNNTEL